MRTEILHSGAPPVLKRPPEPRSKPLGPAPVRVLLVEDDEQDAALILMTLRRAGYAPYHRRVDKAADLAAALRDEPWDVVIADYTLPSFDAPGALEIVQGSGLDLPFIVVSGTICEDMAISMMKMGAHDYMTKNSLARLVVAMERELRDAEERRARRRAEQSLNRSETFARAILRDVPEAIVMVDDEGKIESINPTAEHTFGYAPGEAIGMRFDALVGWPEGAGGGDLLAPGRRQVVGRRANGGASPFPAELTVSAMLPFERALKIALVRDVSDRKVLEEQLLQAQKTESLGRLAGGIAHDFNNLLAVILSYVNLAIQDVEGGSRVHGDLEEIQDAAQRAAGLTRQLLTFSRRNVLEPRLLNLNELIQDMSRMLQRVISEDISLVLAPSPDIGMVRADRGQIEQVLMNLVLNARDAMPDGGKLTIETQRAQIDDVYAAQHACERAGTFVLLAVSDTGTGMTDEVKSRVFEPFYTSKEAGKGTGLGLATTYGIVKQSGGFIWLYSEPGRGTTFKVYLPSVTAEADEPVEAAQPLEIPRGTETVLVVEDEPALRKVAVRGLRDHGYVVLEAAVGDEALEVAELYQGDIHLLVTDVVMPGLSGPKLAERIRTTRPAVKALFTSGYTDAACEGQGIVTPLDLLQKPFTISSLARKAYETLRRP